MLSLDELEKRFKDTCVELDVVTAEREKLRVRKWRYKKAIQKLKELEQLDLLDKEELGNEPEDCYS